jgi:hypothetical protein
MSGGSRPSESVVATTTPASAVSAASVASATPSQPLRTYEELMKLVEGLGEEGLNKMPDEDVLQLRKEMNPYGRTIEGSDKILVFSYTDLRKKYLEKLMTTAMIGFLNRMCNEYLVPDGLPAVDVHAWLKDPSLLSPPAGATPDVLAAYAANLEGMKKRVVIKEFLEDMFQYDPDVHVKPGYVPNPDDKSRRVVKSAAARRAIQRRGLTNVDFKLKMSGQDINKAAAAAESKDAATEDSSAPDGVLEMLPPKDTFFRFRNYLEVNYEAMLRATNDLYAEKPDLDTAINPYAWFNTVEEADAFIDKHRNEVIASVMKAHSGKWNLFGDYKCVIDSVRFFNDKTVVLEEIFKQQEEDAKLGVDLMKKRIVRKKQDNVRENGPDDEAFLKWKKENSALKEIKEGSGLSEDLPDNAVQIDVFTVKGNSVEKSHIFTESEESVKIG